MNPSTLTDRAGSEAARFWSYLIFPLTLGTGLFTTYLGTQLINPIAAAGAVSIVSIGVVAILERLLPYRRDWNHNRGDLPTDILHTVIHQILLSRGLNLLYALLLAGATAWLAERYGSSLWPHHWPLLAQLLLVLVIAEFGRYWVHRFSHRSPWLWRLHAVHHSPKRLYVLNAGRVHSLEKALYLLPESIPFILLGTNIECLALYVTFNSIHGSFQHGNVKVRLGPLNYFFSMAELHRWHHSKIVEESDHNFGNNLAIWDLVFGTWYLPKDREVGPLGLLNQEYPETFLKQLAAPFHRRDLSKEDD